MLEVQIVRNNGTIDFNFEDIKDALASELELYKNLVFTEDTKADAKKTVAELRKLKKQIGDKRIEVKKLYMQPYTDFEAKVKELDKLINEPIAFITEQIDAFEQKRIEEKRELINEIYLEAVSGREDMSQKSELEKNLESCSARAGFKWLRHLKKLFGIAKFYITTSAIVSPCSLRSTL